MFLKLQSAISPLGTSHPSPSQNLQNVISPRYKMAVKTFLCSPATILLFSCVVNLSSGKYVIRLRVDAQCPNPGYFRDETDCRKFYRCAEHPTGVLGEKYITRSEFNCPPGTIFDEALSSCNHIMFVHNIPPGCSVSGAGVIGVSNGGGSGGDSNFVSATTTDVPTTSPATPSIIFHTESTTLRPTTTTHYPGIQVGQPTQLPLMPPENIQIIPGGGEQHQQQPMLPGIQPPMFPSISLPMPGGGGDQQQPMLPGIQPPMFPSINLPMPGGGGDQQQSMFPSINFPMVPGDQGQQQPMFPSINFPNLPGSQGQPPMIPDIPSVPSGSQQQQSILSSLLGQHFANRDPQRQQVMRPSLPSINFPSGSFTFQPPLNLQQGMPIWPNNQLQMQNQNNQQVTFTPEQNLQNLSNSLEIAITAQNNGQSENKPGVGGWLTPQQFPEQQHTVVKPTQQGDSSDWVIPDNFPTFYSAFSRGSPIFLSAFSSNPLPLIFI